LTDTVLADTVVIVTGGSTATGREFSHALAGRGYAVVVVYLDDQKGAEAVVDGILGANGTAIAVRADIADELDVERLFSETVAAFGGVDVIVHADPRAVGVVNQHASRRLRDGGAIVTVGISEAVTPMLFNQLRARGITIAGPQPGLKWPGLGPDITGYVAFLDQLRLGAADRP
jgi:3-oxoacyl-[acyl-carrier protein] reductase